MPLIVLTLLVVSSVQSSLATTNGSSSQVENVNDYIARTFPQLCPYEPLCHQDAAKTATGKLGSCCLPCSCREHCHLFSTCCPDKRLTTRESISQMTPSADMFQCSAAFIGKPSHHTYYKMINKCQPNTTTEGLGLECETETERVVSDMTPITDLDTGITYRNAYCSRCHGVTAGLPWTIYYTCGTNMLQTPRGVITSVASLFQLASCTVKFLPPSAVNVQSDQCSPFALFDTCPETGNWTHDESSELIKMACEMLKIPQIPYGNVYCSMCHGNSMSGLETCVRQDLVGVPSNTFTGILRYGSDSPQEDPDEERDKDGLCRAGMIMDTHTGSCREVVCPQFKHLLNGHCEKILTNYNHIQTLLVLKLVPDDVRFIEHETAISKKTAATTCLRTLTNDRRDLSVSLHAVAETTAEFPGPPYLTVLATISSQFVPDQDILQWIYDRLNQSFTYTSQSGHVFSFDVSLDARIYIPFLRYTGLRRNHFDIKSGTILKDLAANLTLVSLYQQQVSTDYAGVFLSRLLFCQQIRLNQSEYKDFGLSVSVLAPNITLYTFDFVKISFTSEVRVCVADYLSESSSGRHAADSPSFRMGLVYGLVVVVAFCLVAGVLAGAIYRHRHLPPSSS